MAWRGPSCNPAGLSGRAIRVTQGGHIEKHGLMSERTGFISTRFAGYDGVSLESAKWANVLDDFDHKCFWYAGRLDRNPDVSYCVPEAFFKHPENAWISDNAWGHTRRPPLLSDRIRSLADYLKATLHDFAHRYELSLLVVENALSIPMHIPLGVALAEFLYESGLPAIAHHHDFYWERSRFSVNAVADYLDMAFPARLPALEHVVINRAAQEELSWRKGMCSTLVPNVLDFENPPEGMDDYAADAREQLGLDEDDTIILQPTRVVPRKGIERAIELVARLDDPSYKLVVSHPAGDEGEAYYRVLQQLADQYGVDLRIVSTRISEYRYVEETGQKMYTLWDLYPHADLVTYPSMYEGFGNAFLEAIYYHVPVLVNRYSTFVRDIEPKGFKTPVMNDVITSEVVEEVRRVIEDEDYKRQIVEQNFAVARRFYSYSVLRDSLRSLLDKVTGVPGNGNHA